MATSLAHGGFGTPTSDDRRPWLWVVSIVSSTYSVLTLAARLMAKFEILAAEDAILGAAYLFGMVQWGLFARSTYVGLGGRAQPAESLGKEGELFFSSQAALLCAIYLAKLSVLWFARRVFSGAISWNERIFEIAIGFATLCGVASVAVFSAGCNFNHALGPSPDHCTGFVSDARTCSGNQTEETDRRGVTQQQARWAVIQVLDAITEISIVALPIYYLSKNTVNLSSKITVVALFGLRLPCIALMAATATSYKPIEHGAAPHTSAVAPAAIWSEVLLGYALSSASFPCIRTFLTAFLADSKYRIHESTRGSYNQRSRSGTYQQNSTPRSVRVTAVIDAKPDAHLPGEAESIASDASQRMMIERTVEIEMTVESGSSRSIARQEPRTEFPYQGSC